MDFFIRKINSIMRHIMRLLTISILILSAFLSISCHNKESEELNTCTELEQFRYPDSKYWAHRVINVAMGRAKAPLFDGLEVDLFYSEWQDKLLVCHDVEDSIAGITFDMFLDSLTQPVTNCFWLDMKNLTSDNVHRVAHLILTAARRHDIKNKIMVEFWDTTPLSIIKDSGLHIILWVDNPYYSGRSEEEWLKYTKKQLESLHPDALSGDYHIFPLLPDSFPDHNIHIWDTPRDYNDTNVAHSRLIAAHPSVKVVLVDYPTPPEN